MPWVFVIGVKAPDGSIEQREFEVHDERIAKILRRIVFDKHATQEELDAFGAEVASDAELAREWQQVSQYLELPLRH
jgi:hypothetical protein